MTSHTLPGIGIQGGWSTGDAWTSGGNSNWLALSSLVQLVTSGLGTTLPGSPTQGTIFILSAAAGSHPTTVAVYDNSAWTYYTPSSGWRAYNTATATRLIFNGTDWTTDTDTSRLSISGGTAVSMVLSGSVISGGTEVAVNHSGGTFFSPVVSGGVVSGATVLAGAFSGGVMSGTTHTSDTMSGGTISGAVISGGSLNVPSPVISDGNFYATPGSAYFYIAGSNPVWELSTDGTGYTNYMKLQASNGDSAITAVGGGSNLQIRLNAKGAGGLRLGTTTTGDLMYVDNWPGTAVSNWFRFFAQASGANPIMTNFTGDGETSVGMDIDTIGSGIINANSPLALNTGGFVGGSGNSFYSYTDANANLGQASHRFGTVYAATGSINTSDETEKTASTEIDMNKLLDAVDAIEPFTFQLNDAIAAKGATNARIHTGHSAQAVYAALTAQGVRPERCAIWCEDALTTPKAVISPATQAVTDMPDPTYNRPAKEESLVSVEHVPKLDASGNQIKRQGLRYDQLHNLLHAASKRRITNMEKRISELESIVANLQSFYS